MSLVDAMMEDFTILDEITEADGEGGKNTVWVDGATIKAALVRDSSMQAKRAEKEGVTSVYTVTTFKNAKLPYHTVLRREKDQTTYRVTSEGGEKESPEVSTLNLSQVSAEKWSLPRNDKGSSN